MNPAFFLLALGAVGGILALLIMANRAYEQYRQDIDQLHQRINSVEKLYVQAVDMLVTMEEEWDGKRKRTTGDDGELVDEALEWENHR